MLRSLDVYSYIRLDVQINFITRHYLSDFRVFGQGGFNESLVGEIIGSGQKMFNTFNFQEQYLELAQTIRH